MEYSRFILQEECGIIKKTRKGRIYGKKQNKNIG